MLTIRINTGKVGLVFRRGDFKEVISEGSYWLMPYEQVMQYDLAKPFFPPVELNILLRNEKLAGMLTVVEVKDNEIVLQYENGNLKNVLTPGRYVYWKGLVQYRFITVDLGKYEISEEVDKPRFKGEKCCPM